MRVEYKFWLNGKEILLSEECKNDKEVFKFLNHVEEIYGNTVCVRNGEYSDKVSVSVRKTTDSTGKKEYEYFELVCHDPSNPECNFAKRQFGTPEDDAGSLFPKNKTDDGKWQPWKRFNKDTGKEE